MCYCSTVFDMVSRVSRIHIVEPICELRLVSFSVPKVGTAESWRNPVPLVPNTRRNNHGKKESGFPETVPARQRRVVLFPSGRRWQGHANQHPHFRLSASGKIPANLRFVANVGRSFAPTGRECFQNRPRHHQKSQRNGIATPDVRRGVGVLVAAQPGFSKQL